MSAATIVHQPWCNDHALDEDGAQEDGMRVHEARVSCLCVDVDLEESGPVLRVYQSDPDPGLSSAEARELAAQLLTAAKILEATR